MAVEKSDQLSIKEQLDDLKMRQRQLAAQVKQMNEMHGTAQLAYPGAQRDELPRWLWTIGVVLSATLLAIVSVGLIYYFFVEDEGQAEQTSSIANGTVTRAEPLGLVYYPYRAEDYGTGPCAPSTGGEEAVLEFAVPPQLCVDPTGRYQAVFTTSHGTVTVELDPGNTPGTVNNFVNLARFGYYDDTLIFRSDPSIGILQGGSPHTNDANDPGPGYGIWDEGEGFNYVPGQLVMARTDAPNSSDAQFFFTVTENAALLDESGAYVVFGTVISGLEALESMLASHVDDPQDGLGGAPDPPVVVDSVTIHPLAPEG